MWCVLGACYDCEKGWWSGKVSGWDGLSLTGLPQTFNVRKKISKANSPSSNLLVVVKKIFTNILKVFNTRKKMKRYLLFSDV